MKLLNLGCGSTRPAHQGWINIDNLHAIFPNPGCPERINMDGEPNYLNHDIREGLPFEDNKVTGIVASHLLEHLDCQEGVKLLRECKRVLKIDGVLRVSVPDPKRFYELTMANCIDWGEPNPHKDLSFMEWALFFHEHKQLITIDSLKCMFHVVGFSKYEEKQCGESWIKGLQLLDNRPKFSLFMEAKK